MIALIGLGNPGDKYSLNRHNIGFMAIDKICENLNAEPISGSKINGDCFKLQLHGKKIILFRSHEFMNECGLSISKIIKFYKIKIENLFVFHDDLDLKLGKIRIKEGGNTAGHNGLKSIDSYIGKNYNRIRMGIEHPGNKELVIKHVLSNFKKNESTIFDQINENISNNIDLLIKREYSTFMNKIKIQ